MANAIFWPFHPNLFKILTCYANSDDGIVFSGEKSSGNVLWHFGEEKKCSNSVMKHRRFATIRFWRINYLKTSGTSNDKYF